MEEVNEMARPAIHPGEILADELAELGVTPTELSRQINVPPNRVTQIIHGRRGVTGDTALRLGHWFGTSARFWLNLQSAYDLRIAEEKAGDEISRLPTRPSEPGSHEPGQHGRA
jgi:addiction module HigA family antidote